MSLFPTVILVNDISERLEKRWYHGKTCVGIKIPATDLSTALRNATELANILIEKIDTEQAAPPVLILYTDGGPEHQATFLNVKTVMIYLQKYLELDLVLPERTTPGFIFLLKVS